MNYFLNDAAMKVWLRLYVTVQRHRTKMVALLCQEEPPPRLSSPMTARSIQTIAGFLDRVKDPPTGMELEELRGHLLWFERRFETLSPPEQCVLRQQQDEGGITHILVDWLSLPFQGTGKKAIKGEWERGRKRAMALSHEWIQMNDKEFAIDWFFRNVGLHEKEIRVATVALTSPKEMKWQCDPDVRNRQGKILVRCLGAVNKASISEQFEKALAVAEAQRVHILLLPELTVDETLLSDIRDGLRTLSSCSTLPSLRLVVAGSRHTSDHKDPRRRYFNRCTVLGEGGEILFEQDKLEPFVISTTAMGEIDCPLSDGIEPGQTGNKLVVFQSELGLLMTPICLDFLQNEWIPRIKTDLHLVPAMTPSLTEFAEQGRALGRLFASACVVANARGMVKEKDALATALIKGEITCVKAEPLQIWTFPRK